MAKTHRTPGAAGTWGRGTHEQVPCSQFGEGLAPVVPRV